MFKISYVVSDTKLPDMLRACHGHVVDLEVLPVSDNTTSVPSSSTPRKPARGPTSTPRNFVQELGWEKDRTFRADDLVKRCPSLGMKPASHWYIISHELKNGRVKRVDSGLYKVIV